MGSASAPQVSVVMSVYNGAQTLASTIESVLGQTGCDFEFIIVNDGSTDASGKILDEYASKDKRLRVIHQENTGLTRALIVGCSAARGEFIARQDCGDWSLPQRLSLQSAMLSARDELIAISCNAQFYGEKGDFLFSTEMVDSDLCLQVKPDVKPAGFTGPPHHGSVMFRRSTYELVGGYRLEFYFAQDLDLWVRLVEHGEFAVLPEALYRASLAASAISGAHRPEQERLAQLICDAARMRAAGTPEHAVLELAARVRPNKTIRKATREASGNYFIGSMLGRRDPKAALPYFRSALRGNPLHWRAALKFCVAQCRALISSSPAP
jgi:glycosyltransferase involved in cell wall biosynthesis